VAAAWQGNLILGVGPRIDDVGPSTRALAIKGCTF